MTGTQEMNVLSLFSGVGGLELGLERAGMTTVGQVEIDPYCRQDDDQAFGRRAGSENLHSAPQPYRRAIGNPWAAEPSVDRVADGFSPELDRPRLKALGNAVVPQVAEFVGRRLMAVAA